MNPVMQIGVAGMNAAEARASIRAYNIVQAPAQAAQYFAPVQTTIAAAPVVRAQTLNTDMRRGPFDGLAGDIVDLRAAAHAYRASAEVFRTGARMSRTLLDALA